MDTVVKRRTVWSAVAVVAAAALVAGGWFAAGAFTSPEQWAAQAAAPPPAPVVAEVTRGDLVDERRIGATLVPAATGSATLTPVAGAARSIITESKLATGSEITAGTVVVRINGEPVFALTSPFSFYRDIGIGDTGPDVKILQQNLQALGLLSGADGVFGARTAAAVTQLYRGAGATAPTRAAPTADRATVSNVTKGTATKSTVTAVPAATGPAPAGGAGLDDADQTSKDQTPTDQTSTNQPNRNPRRPTSRCPVSRCCRPCPPP